MVMENSFKKYLIKNNYEKFDIKAVLFDMDGILYDSMKYHAKAWYETMSKNNLQSTPEEFYIHEGRTGGNTINLIIQRNLNREATEDEKKNIYKYKSDLFNKYNKNETIPHVYDVLKAVKELGLNRVLVTGSGQKKLIDNLNVNFPDMFQQDMMVTAYDVKYGKPHPEPYLMGLKKAGNLNPNQAIVIENAPMGVEAAVAAGIFTIAVNTGPLPNKMLIDAGADIVFPSMAELLKYWDKHIKKLIY